MADVMLDIETMGFRPECVVLTIGAIKFDPYNPGLEPHSGFYQRLNVDQQLELGRTVDESTMEWWSQQTESVREEAFADEDRVALVDFAKDLNKYMVGVDNIWAQGPTFDFVIIENLFRMLDVPVNWQFWQIRDSRTLFQVAGDPRKADRAEAHNALADCYYQAKGVQEVFKQLGVKKR